jgi:hypothetical protein
MPNTFTLYAAYADWVSAVADWLDTTSGPTYDRIGDFIHMAELQLDRRLRLREAMAFNSTTIDNDGIITLPADYSQMKQVIVGPQETPLEALTPDQYQTMRSRNSQNTGQPCYYTIIGEKLQFVPLGADLDVNIAYYRKAEPLGDLVPENVYSTYAAPALLAGSLLYGFMFMADEERTTIWRDLFQKEIDTLNADAQRGELPTSPLKMRSGRRMPHHRTGVR